jgi:proline dehydrogenase
MLRTLIFALSRSRFAAHVAANVPGFRGFSRRFVAGSTQRDVIDVVRRLNAAGFDATVSFLGEAVTTTAEVEAAVAEFTSYAGAVRAQELRSHLSIKLTELGLAFDPDLAARSLETVLAHAAPSSVSQRFSSGALAEERESSSDQTPATSDQAVFVRIDMEDSQYTQAALDLFRAARARHANVGIVAQAYLRRSAADVEALAREGAPLRLVKGAYREPEDVAFQLKEEVDASFARLVDAYFSHMAEGGWLAIATHDGRMVRAAIRAAASRSVRRDRFEFQMLYGIRTDLQRSLLAEGYRVRIYVPYGSHWYPYLMRRLAERPANLWFFLRNALRRS